jgi:hypothetical protein
MSYQRLQLTGEVVDRNEKNQLTVKTTISYVTNEAQVIQEAYIIITPEGTQIAMDALAMGNLVYMAGRLCGDEKGNPVIMPDGSAVFIIRASVVMKLAQKAEYERSSDLFEIAILGNLGRDPEMKVGKSGKEFWVGSVCANSYVGRDSEGNYKTEPMWFKLVKFTSGGLEKMSKGGRALIFGRPNFDPETGGPGTWTADDGTVRASFEVVVPFMIPLEKQEERHPNFVPEDPKDIPF